MLVDHEHAFRPFGNDVGARDLPQHAHHRHPGLMDLRTRRRIVFWLGLLRRWPLDLGSIYHPASQGLLRDRRARRCRGRERDGRNDVLLLPAERLVSCPHDGSANGPLIGELHFGLRRMDVDVDRGRVNVDPHHPQWMPPDHQQGVIGLLERIVERPMLDQASIYEEEQVLAMGARDAGRADPATDPNTGHRAVRSLRTQLARLVGQLRSEHTDRGIQIVAIARRLENLAPIVRQGPPNVSPIAGVGAHQPADIRRFGGILPQKLSAGRNIAKQVLHCDRGSGGHGIGPWSDLNAELHPQ